MTAGEMTARRTGAAAVSRRGVLAGACGAAVAVFGWPGGGAPAAAADDAAAVRRQFEALRDAARQGDGKRLTAGLSRDALTRLEAVREAARQGGGAHDRRLSPAERLAAGSLRRVLTPADLNRKSLEDLAAQALSRRAALGRELDQAAIGVVQVRGDRASAPLLVNAQPTLFSADFVREAGQWKLDIAPSIKRGDMLLMGMAAMKGGGEDAIIDGILARMESRLRQAG